MHYQVEHLLGTGGIAKVYATTDPLIAVKLIESTESTESLQAVRREFNCLKSLNHSRIVRAYEWIQIDNHIGYSMQRLEGYNGKVFAGRLQRLPPSERHQKIISIGIQMLETIEYLHQHDWLHRDIKPSNLMIQESAQTTLIDFGTVIQYSAQPTSKGLVGTPRYASPEQIAQKSLTTSSDIYSIGSTLYFLLLNQAPFASRNRSDFIDPSLIDPTVPKHLERLIVQMMSANPNDRGNSTDLIHQLTQVQTTVTPLAGREAPLKIVSQTLRRVHNGEQIHLHIDGTRGSGKTWLQNLVVQSAKRQNLTVIKLEPSISTNVIFEQIAQRSALLIVSVHPYTQKFGLPIITIQVPWLTLAQIRRSIFSKAPKTLDISLMAERLFSLTGGLPKLLLEYLEAYTTNLQFTIPLEPDNLEIGWYPNLTSPQISVVQMLSIVPEPCSSQTIDFVLEIDSTSILRSLESFSLVQQIGEDWCIANDWTVNQTLHLHPVENTQSHLWVSKWRENSVSDHRPIEDIEHLSTMGKLANAKLLGLNTLQHTPRSTQARCLIALGQVYLDIGLLNKANSVLADATALSKAMNDQDTYLRSHALRARVSLEIHQSSPTGAAHALDRLGKIISSQNPWVLSIWLWACGALGDVKTWNKWLSQTLSSIDGLPPVEQLRCHYSMIRGACALGELALANELVKQGLDDSVDWPLLHWEYARVHSLLHGLPPPIAGEMVYNLAAEEILCFKQRWVRVKGKHPDPTWHH